MSDITIPDWDKHETGIYFLLAKEVGRVKIGRTINIVERVSNLNCASPVELELLAYFLAPNDAELFIHRTFDKYRVRGEWFTFSEQINQVVKRLNTLKNACFMDCLADHHQEDYSDSKYDGICDSRVKSSANIICAVK